MRYLVNIVNPLTGKDFIVSRPANGADVYEYLVVHTDVKGRDRLLWMEKLFEEGANEHIHTDLSGRYFDITVVQA